jgi:hypothetical protein
MDRARILQDEVSIRVAELLIWDFSPIRFVVSSSESLQIMVNISQNRRSGIALPH